MNMKIIFCKTLTDNYVWIIINNLNNDCIIIDPGEYLPIIKKIDILKLNPKAIFLTHHHLDHTSGVKNLLYKYPKISIYGPSETRKYKITHVVNDKFIIHNMLNSKFFVISTPGHTKKHVSYYCPPYLFCGDTLFSGGCGNVENEMMIKMYCSLKKISRLPDNTLIYCSHEYTKSNLKFFKKIFQKEKFILNYYKILSTYKKRQSTLPSILSIEKKINPFLQLHKKNIKNYTKIHKELSFPLNVLTYLRRIKNKS